jgi:hypothetical protein
VGLTSLEIDAIVLVVVLGTVLAALLLYSLRRLRHRRDRLVQELQTPELRHDRAFNRIAMARREADILERSGADVTEARVIIARAQGSFDTRNFDRAYEYAQSAHEALVRVRQSGALRGGNPPGASAAPVAARTTAAVPVPTETPANPPPSIPKNRVESQFELHLLDQELAAARSARAGDGSLETADALRRQAQTAYDRADYTEAFRLGLRARRQLGGKVESLPATGTPGGATSTAERSPPNGGDAAATADAIAGSSRCPACGYPVAADDRFCRGCGKPKETPACPVCDAPRLPDDTFCGKCGARFT